MRLQFLLLSWRVCKRKFLVICGKFSAEVNVKGRMKIYVRKAKQKMLYLWIVDPDPDQRWGTHLCFITGALSRLWTCCRLLLKKELIVLVEEQVTSITKISTIIIILTIISFNPLIVWLKVALNCSSKLSTLHIQWRKRHGQIVI